MVLKLTFGDQQCLFDDETLNPESPGIIRGAWVKGHFYESAFLEYIHSLELSGGYVDVGAHIGNHTVFFSVLCSADHVYAFEPLDQNYVALLRNIELNGQQGRVTTFKCGADFQDGEADHTFAGRTWHFPVRRIDSLIDGPISLMKLDIEGMELRALKGARRILRRDHPVLFVEAHTRSEYAALARWLSRHRYQHTGRVFNSTPTYEFTYVPADPLRDRLQPGRLAHGLAWRLRRLRNRFNSR